MNARDPVPAGLEYTKTVVKVTFCTEFYVWKLVFFYLSALGAFFIRLPLQLFRFTKSPEHKHELAVFLSFIICYPLLRLFGLDLHWGTRIIASHSVWKVWSVYTALMVALKFLLKVNKFTHQMIRGAVRSNTSILLPSICHAASDGLSYWCLNAIIGTYLGGVFRPTPIFVAVCWHVQGALAELFFPELLSTNPCEREALSRMIMLASLLVYSTRGNVLDIVLQPILEFSYAIIRYFIVSLSDDAEKFFRSVQCPPTTADSIILRFPLEAFAVCILATILAGPPTQSAALTAALVLLGVTSSRTLHK